jgi:GT2 family glycosyltransferase
LVLGEIGMDTLRNGEINQTEFLAGHSRAALLAGLAGLFVFSWTDEWYTGGCAIDDWAFGITHADRSPKASYHALREVYELSPADLLEEAPRVSVVVCTYNGGPTLDQCLRSLRALDYPRYEVIVVDDGSTDDTRAILDRFPEVRRIHQPNRGLSAARNVGLQAATGAIIAYTDSDCFAHADWLTHLVHQLQRSGADAVGGPNLTPEDGWLAACVGAAPGQPTHVLESDQVAEHVPGCNMAFRREALLAINGFDPQYRKAGDDVDLCWRLQQAGYWITFAPGAFVWHHRRQTPRAYFRQQAGYGEAEALLRFKHPDKFNSWGNGKWRGILYGPALQGLRFGQPIIYRGTFGTGLFQCVYQPGPAHWAMMPSTLEWHAGLLLLALASFLWLPAAVLAGGMLLLSILVAALQAAQARLDPKHEGIRSRLLIASLCYRQPLVRSWWRYRTRLLSACAPNAGPAFPGNWSTLPRGCRRTVSYWSENGADRTQLLHRALLSFGVNRWGKILDSGWADWDLEVHCYPAAALQICTVQEDHGGSKHLIRVRYRLRPQRVIRLLGGAAVLGGLAAAALGFWAGVLAALVPAVWALRLWRRSTSRASQALAIVDAAAADLGLLLCDPSPDEAPAPAVAPTAAVESSAPA